MTANSNISVPPYGLFYFKFARGAQLGARGRNPLDPWDGLPDPVNSIERMNESQKGNFATCSRLFSCLLGCLYSIFVQFYGHFALICAICPPHAYNQALKVTNWQLIRCALCYPCLSALLDLLQCRCLLISTRLIASRHVPVVPSVECG